MTDDADQFLSLFLACFCSNALVSSYQFNITLVEDKYWLYWNFNKATEEIKFAVRVKTTGWIGFGLSPNGQMPGSDVVIGWLDDQGTHFNVIKTEICLQIILSLL